MKSFLSMILILGSFWWMNTATSKYGPPLVCEGPIDSYLNKDSLVRSYYERVTRDTIIIRAYKDSLWDKKTQEICRILRDSCTRKAYKIMIIDTTSDGNLFNSPYGRQIYIRKCP